MAPPGWASRRLAMEHRIMSEEPTPGIKVVPRPDNDRHLDVEITGSMWSPYQGGVFRLEMIIPDDYPVVPPKVRFLTKIYHPNIDDKGRICLDVLEDSETWSAVWHISTILLSIQALLGAPNPDDPLDPEIGKRWRETEDLAIKTAEAWTRLYAKPTAPTESEEKTQAGDATQSRAPPRGLSARALAKRPLVVAHQTEIDECPGLAARASSTRTAGPRLPPARSPDIFQYGSLGRADETRILRLQPGELCDPIVGIIQHITLPSYCHGDSDSEFFDGPETPAYNAVSYAWGKPDVTDGVYLYGPNDDPANAGMLGLAQNCALALRRLRLSNKERPLWVDAICINQADVAERSAQVRIMHRIYKTASCVLIYLGEGSVATDQAIDILQDDADGRRQCITDSPTEAEEINLQTFFSLPWFTRVWVIQEVAWAATALAFCGSRVVSWETLHNAYTSSIGRISRLQPLPHVLSFGEPRPRGVMTGNSLLEELKNARVCDATDPRDKIYAVLELFHRRTEDPRLAIDYERGVSDLYTDITDYLLWWLPGLDVLAEIDDEPPGVPGLVIPTWVINWAAPPRPKYRFSGCFAGGRFLGRGERVILHRGQFMADESRRELKVTAAHLHTVGTSSKSFDFPRLSSAGQLASTGILDWDSPDNVPTFEQLLEHIERVESSTSNSDRFDSSIPAPPDMSGFRQRWSPEMKRTKQMLAKMRNRKIFTTQNGLPAIGPLHTQGGDRIFAVDGESMCHVLRPTRRADVFTYVGGCFLYGHMQLWWRTRYGLLDDRKEKAPWEWLEREPAVWEWHERGPAVRDDVGLIRKENVPWEDIVII